MTIGGGSSKEMPRQTNMQTSRHGRARSDARWLSPYHWERHSGRRVWMAQGGRSGAFTGRLLVPIATNELLV